MLVTVKRTVMTGPGGAWDIGYHVAWCPKYRRPVLSGAIGDRCADLIRAKAVERGWEIAALEVSAETVQRYIDTQPERPWRKGV